MTKYARPEVKAQKEFSNPTLLMALRLACNSHRQKGEDLCLCPGVGCGAVPYPVVPSLDLLIADYHFGTGNKGGKPFDEMNQAPRRTFTGSDFEHLGLAQMAGGTPRIAPVPVKFPDPGHHPDSTMFYS